MLFNFRAFAGLAVAILGGPVTASAADPSVSFPVNRSSATALISEWMLNIKYEELPVSVVHTGRRLLINGLAAGFSGATQSAVQTLVNLDALAGSAPRASVLGQRSKTSIAVVPAALAVAEANNISAEDLLTAVIIGVEINCRVAWAGYPLPESAGWHATGVVGPLGSAAAVARLMGLDWLQSTRAIGFAGDRSAGTQAAFGTDGKAYHAAAAARDGYLGAAMASAGLTSPEDYLETHFGWYQMFSPHSQNLTTLLHGLGERWELFTVGLKEFPNGIVSQPVEQAGITLHKEYGIEHTNITSILVHGNHNIPGLMGGYPHPSTSLQAKFSYQYLVAVAILDGKVTAAEFNTSRVLQPDVQALASKVSCDCNYSDAEIPINAATLSVTLANGTNYSVEVKAAVGTPGHPMSDSGLDAKFRETATPLLGKVKVERLLELLWRMKSKDDLQEVLSIIRMEDDPDIHF